MFYSISRIINSLTEIRSLRMFTKQSFSRLICLSFAGIICSLQVFAQQPDVKISKKDRKKDIEMVTTEGIIILRLSDSTPIHRDNFLKLVKSGYYNGVSFHRVIAQFMIQAGDPKTKGDSILKIQKSKDSLYTLPAEFRPGLFHKRGALAAARTPDEVNPVKASSGNQFYIVQGRTFTDAELDSVEINRLKGRKIPAAYRQYYKTIGGTPQLDQNYTVFGEVVSGMDVVDKIAQKPTTGRPGGDKPLQDIKIIETKLVSRKRH
jgi:cyclophilin family peptidyl-prolyl cis-trans isomerase